MARFRKKPVVIEAVQWTGVNFQEVSDFIRISSGTDSRLPNAKGDFAIITLEDGSNESYSVQHVASMNDWIIRGVANEVYACKPSIFDCTYEAVED